LDYAIISDHSLQVAFWLCVITLIVSIAILLEVVWLRFHKLRNEKLRKQFVSKWQPILVRRAMNEEVTLPILLADEVNWFLVLWLHFQESIVDESKIYLNETLEKLNISDALEKKLDKGSLPEKMMTVSVIGHSREERMWDKLVHLLNHSNAVISILSARALLNINPEKAINHVFPAITIHRDWPAPKIARILKESPEFVMNAFVAYVGAAVQSKQPYAIRLLRLLQVQEVKQLPEFIRNILIDSDNTELVLASLKLVRNSVDIDLVRNRINDNAWQVRAQVAKLLGKIGDKQDVSALSDLLSSKDWWARYHAANSIRDMPLMPGLELEMMSESLGDPFARDMMNFAIAGKG
jgi:hypothetical protein